MTTMIHARQSHAVASGREREYLEGWQRARAELQNFRKRLAEEQATQTAHLVRQAVEPLLQLADNFQSLKAHVPEKLKDDAWAQGVGHVGRQLEAVLAQFGVEAIEPAGQPFDPSQHEAVAHDADSGQASGTVTAVVARGWRLGGRVLRPAKVTVAE